MIGARKGSPLAVGHGDGEMYLGSDAIALAPFTDTITYLDDGDWAVMTHKGVEIRDEKGAVVKRDTVKTTASAALVDKGNHKHFMAKEIHEQPEVVGHTLRALHRHDDRAGAAAGKAAVRLARSSTGCRSRPAAPPIYAGLVAKYWFERFARLSVEIDIASEFRYREAPLSPGDLAIFISQSGETADTLATLRYAKRAEAARALRGQRADLDHRARKRRGDADARRPRDRRRLDQGVHLPACGAGLPRDRRRAGAWHAFGRRTSKTWCAR